MTLHPQILKCNGRGRFVILTYKEFLAIQEMLEDAEDLRDLRAAREADDPSEPSLSLEEVKIRLGLTRPRKPRRSLASRRRNGNDRESGA